MLCIISPAKSLDFDTPAPTSEYTTPDFLERSQALIERLRTLAPADVARLMKISDKLAALNVARFADWQTPFKPNDPARPAKQALFAFTGDVYTGMAANTFEATDIQRAQQRLRILSGLYGLLRPLDLIMPYRLEMGIRLDTAEGNTLYDVWQKRLVAPLQAAIDASGEPVLINLASNEYFKAVDTQRLGRRIITPVFKDEKNGQLKIISFHAKKARGMMAAWMIRQNIDTPEALKAFDEGGYRYNAALSQGDTLVFTR